MVPVVGAVKVAPVLEGFGRYPGAGRVVRNVRALVARVTVLGVRRLTVDREASHRRTSALRRALVQPVIRARGARRPPWRERKSVPDACVPPFCRDVEERSLRGDPRPRNAAVPTRRAITDRISNHGPGWGTNGRMRQEWVSGNRADAREGDRLCRWCSAQLSGPVRRTRRAACASVRGRVRCASRCRPGRFRALWR